MEISVFFRKEIFSFSECCFSVSTSYTVRVLVCLFHSARKTSKLFLYLIAAGLHGSVGCRSDW